MKKKKSRKVPWYLILTLLVMLVITIYIVITNEQQYKESINYYTGDIYSPNYSANLIDNLKEENAVISPLNINQSLISFYLASDNNTEKELRNYYKASPEKAITTIQDKYINNKTDQVLEDSITTNYEKLIKEFFDKKYNELTVDRINNLEESIKLDIQLLIKKINLNYGRINNENKMSVKAINKYKLNKKEINNNSYNIKDNIDTLLDTYESYCLKETIINVNNLYYSNTFERDYLKDLKSTNIVLKNIKELEDTKKTIYLEDNEIISINAFNYTNEWEINFNPNFIKASEFYNGDKVTAVDMMYAEESTYLENNYAIGFKKNYKNNNYSFVGILPKKDEYQASNIDLNSLLKNEKKGPVRIGLPKFSLNSEIDLKDILSNKIDFNRTNLTKLNSTNPKINELLLKTTFTVGDKGTINTSITTNKNISTIEQDYKKEIILNRPFYFLVVNNQTNDIILIGKITNIR